MTELGEFAMFLAVGFTALGLFFGPIGTAVGRRIAGRTDPKGGAGLDEIRGRLDELEQRQAQYAELEERLDFAERVLAQQRDPQALEGGRSERP